MSDQVNTELAIAEMWRAWRNGFMPGGSAGTWNAFEVADRLADEVIRLHVLSGTQAGEVNG